MSLDIVQMRKFYKEISDQFYTNKVQDCKTGAR